MTAAIRTVSETDDVHVIEGYGPAFGGPFNGRDSYRTFASARTDFHWDLFPDSMDEPRFTRPVNYQHGFDADVLNALFRQTRPSAAAIKAIMPPRDPGVRSWQAYRERFVEPKRIVADPAATRPFFTTWPRTCH